MNNVACENCGTAIGKLETPQVLEGHVVCRACYRKLSLSEEISPNPVRPTSHARPRSAHACPQCGSEETALLSMIYSQGTRTTQTSGFAFGDVSEAMISSSVSQSSMAAAAAPPEPKSTSLTLMAVIIGMAAMLLSLLVICTDGPAPHDPREDRGTIHAAWFFGPVGLRMVVIPTFFWLRSRRDNESDYAARRLSWSRTWACRRCGARFYPSKANQEIETDEDDEDAETILARRFGN